MSSYEELLVEMGDISTPFTHSPPWIQLLTLMCFNTALYVAAALLKSFMGMDLLPTLGAMTGAGPIVDPVPGTQGPTTTTRPVSSVSTEKTATEQKKFPGFFSDLKV